MATNWPNSVQTFTNPTAGSALNSPSHADQHTTVNDTVEALQQYAGLVLVKTATIGSGVSSVTVTNAFSATYGNYLVTVNYDSASVNAVMLIRLDGSTSNYKWARVGTSYNSTVAAGGSSSDSWISFAGGLTTAGGGYHVPIFNPYLAKPTTFGPIPWVDSGSANTTNGYHTNSTSYTGVVVAPSAGTITGGTIRVYGFNDG